MLEYHNNNDIGALLENLNMDIILSKNKTYTNISENMFRLYWEIGNLILAREHSGCGVEFINILSDYLKLKFPGNLSFTEKNLKNMTVFAREYESKDFVDKTASKVSWSCNMIILNKIKDIDKRTECINKILEKGWTTEELINNIDVEYGMAGEEDEISKADIYYEDLQSIENKSIITGEDDFIKDSEVRENHSVDSNGSYFVQDVVIEENGDKPSKDEIKNYFRVLKDEYLVDFMEISDEVKEKYFQGQFMKNVTEFFLELNRGFALVGKKYHIELSGGDYYVDLLFYNLKLKCYLIVEFKIGKFRPEYLGILTFHLSIVDDSIKNDEDNPSIGIILCKDGEKLIVQYAFKDQGDPGNGEYGLHGDIPEQFKEILPTVQEIGSGIKMKLKVE
ncbi:PDDEXK nuclease domain-containing protein [Clostridium sp. WILCCON 0269]|uniref:PDDEXK nuclease domain-containing protein n=1 Tax=Candidatus Clostridium eludens TaxID=3381663 RepID=A0ABW8SKX5_9CLOT